MAAWASTIAFTTEDSKTKVLPTQGVGDIGLVLAATVVFPGWPGEVTQPSLTHNP